MATTKRVSAEDAALCQRACQAAACAIQFCLQRKSYQESKCTAYIDQYYNCCETAKQALRPAGGGAADTNDTAATPDKR